MRYEHATSAVLRYDLVSERWDELHPSGRLPDPRYRHATCLVADQMVVWGGYVLQARPVPAAHSATEHGVYASMNADELLLLDLASCSWSRPETRGIPPTPRGGHTLTLIDSKLDQLTHPNSLLYQPSYPAPVSAGADQNLASHSPCSLHVAEFALPWRQI